MFYDGFRFIKETKHIHDYHDFSSNLRLGGGEETIEWFFNLRRFRVEQRPDPVKKRMMAILDPAMALPGIAWHGLAWLRL